MELGQLRGCETVGVGPARRKINALDHCADVSVTNRPRFAFYFERIDNSLRICNKVGILDESARTHRAAQNCYYTEAISGCIVARSLHSAGLKSVSSILAYAVGRYAQRVTTAKHAITNAATLN